MPLSDAKARNAKPQKKPYKLADGDGMFLLVHPNGGKYWRLKYRFDGEKTLAFGVYPEVSILEARTKRLEARKALAAGIDPAELKREDKRRSTQRETDTFESVAREWHEKRKHEWSKTHGDKVLLRLETHIFPKLGLRNVADIRAPELLAVLRIVEQSGALDMTRRLKQMCGQVFMYAIATGRAERNPVPDIQGALKTPVAKHRAYLKPNELPDYLEKLQNYDGSIVTKIALNLMLIVFLRTTELRGGEWQEVNTAKAQWVIPPERMKMKDPHIVPLPRQALKLLTELRKITGDGKYMFPNEHNRVGFMSENTMLFALYRMGYRSRATVHGFRATASTILNENGFAPDVIERQLAHMERDKVRAAYNHAQYLPERGKMMQWWANYLDKAASQN